MPHVLQHGMGSAFTYKLNYEYRHSGQPGHLVYTADGK